MSIDAGSGARKGSWGAKVGAIIAVISVPLLLYASMSRSFRYTGLRAEAQRLEAEQGSWVKENKRLITEISALESPERIDALARGPLGLKKARAENTLDVEIVDDGQ
jgi:cell division protein FtsL